MTRRLQLLEVALVLLLAAAIAAVYPRLPAAVPVHWNIHMQADGWGPRWTLFLLGPVLMVVIGLMTRFGQHLSPKAFSVDRFQATYVHCMVLAFLSAAYLATVTLLTAMGYAFDAGRAVVCGVCVLFALLGNVMGKVRRNFFLGIRTPWALASERVWNATHRVAAWSFVVAGVVALGLCLGGFGAACAVVLLAGVVVPVVWSFGFSRRFGREGTV